jgi:hypothetical protein
LDYLDKYYTVEEIAEMLEIAERMGFSLEAGSEIDSLTLAELDKLVNSNPQ